MATVKPIIKLPRSKSCSTRSNYQDMSTSSYDQQFIASKELYFEDSEDRLSDYDIHTLLQEYKLLQ
jgi:hypothetical protein